MPDAHKNFAVSAVATAPSPATSGTSLVVTAGHGARFPAVPFNAVIQPPGVLPEPTNAEIVRVTNIATDTLTITRAQEGSTARTVVIGDQISAAITAKTVTDVEGDITAHVTDSVDAHDASAISFVPVGTIAATDVQAAIAEAASESSNLAGAVILAPASSARNVIQATTGTVIEAIVKAHAAQSVDLFQAQTSGGTPTLQLTKEGSLTISPTLASKHLLINQIFDTDALWAFAVMAPGANADYGGAISGYVYPDLPTRPAVGTWEVWAFDTNGDPVGYTNTDGNLGQILSGPNATIKLFNDAAFTDLRWSVLAGGGVEMKEIADLAAPAANYVRLYARDNGGGATQYVMRFPTGAVYVLATEGDGAIYRVGGTDVALADGGTGASLVDPNADRIMFWDDSAGAVTWLTAGTGLTITGTTLDAAASGAPSTATYITQTADGGLSAEQALSSLATGLVKNTTGTGVLSIGAQGTDYYAPGGTDVAVADGGTGASTAATARTNLGVYSTTEVATELADQKRVMEILVTDPNGSAITTGDGKAYCFIPTLLNGHNLVAVAAAVTTVSSSGLPTVQIANVTDSVDMLSTKLSIDASEFTSYTAATAAVIDLTKDDVATGDILRIDIDVAGTGAKGLMVALTFEAP